jgi:hypothetical protein
MKGMAAFVLLLMMALSSAGCIGFHRCSHHDHAFVSVGTGYETYIGYEHVSMMPMEIGPHGWIKARYSTDAGDGVAWFNTNALQILEYNPHVFLE